MTTSVLYCLATGSAVTDILKNKIFNGWLLVGVLAGMAVNIFDKDMQESAMEMALKAAITILLLLPIYLVGGMGGGDLKLFAVISLFLPIGELIGCLVLSFFIGAAVGITKMIAKRSLHQTIHFAVPILISILIVTARNGIVCM